MKNYRIVDTVEFPDPRMININMMPFNSNDPYSLPPIYREYWPLISKCNRPNPVSYLTIREGYVVGNVPQSRPGPHTEGFDDTRWGSSPVTWGSWGRQEGLYMANTISNTCVVWDMNIQNTGPMGDCSHLELKDPYYIKANELVWLHDRTPHESLPLKQPAMRQFFRLVVGEISVWYSKHNTRNPLGVPPMAEVVHYDKFAVAQK